MAKILIVDDDLVNIQIFANKLESEGHEVILSPDGQSAQQQLGQKLDFVLLDVMMPKLDGIALLAEIQKGPNKTTPILVHSNLTNEAKQKKCLELGAKEFLLKADYTPAEIIEKIKSYLAET